MYPLLSFRIPICADATNEDIIDALAKWVGRSPHHDYIESILDDILSNKQYANENLIEKSGELRILRCSADGTHYIAMRLDNPVQEQNFLWRAECIFARNKKDAAFHIRVYRAPLVKERPVSAFKSPMIPYLVKVLQDKKLIAENEGSSCPSRSLQFPRILFCDAGETGRLNQALSKLKTELGPIAVIVEGGADCAPEDLRVQYPAAEIDKVYSDVLAPNRGTTDLEYLIGDVKRWVSEVQFDQILPWPETGADGSFADVPSAQQRYCIMSRAMGEFLRKNRQQCGLSQQKLAESAGTTGLIISRLETGRIQRVERSILHNLELSLNLPKGAIEAIEEQEKAVPATERPTEAVQTVISAEAPVQTPKKVGFCRRCGHYLYQDSVYCSECGTKVLH